MKFGGFGPVPFPEKAELAICDGASPGMMLQYQTRPAFGAATRSTNRLVRFFLGTLMGHLLPK